MPLSRAADSAVVRSVVPSWDATGAPPSSATSPAAIRVTGSSTPARITPIVSTTPARARSTTSAGMARSSASATHAAISLVAPIIDPPCTAPWDRHSHSPHERRPAWALPRRGLASPAPAGRQPGQPPDLVPARGQALDLALHAPVLGPQHPVLAQESRHQLRRLAGQLVQAVRSGAPPAPDHRRHDSQVR